MDKSSRDGPQHLVGRSARSFKLPGAKVTIRHTLAAHLPEKRAEDYSISFAIVMVGVTIAKEVLDGYLTDR